VAYVKLRKIKSSLKKALDYIEDPKKTDGQILVTGFQVNPTMASVEFKMTELMAQDMVGDYSRCGSGSPTLAYHMIQSFAPWDKLTPERAHELGQKWANEILDGRFEYVISTHVNKGHIHNHVIFNSVSFVDYKKFHIYNDVEQIDKISNKICENAGLHFTKERQGISARNYKEWAHWKAGTSWKAAMQHSINQAIKKTSDYESFKKELEKDGIEILEGARITFHAKGVESKNGRAAKCRGDRIGVDYTKERILERLSEPNKNASSHNEPLPSPEPFYDKWEARRENIKAIKEMASALTTLRSENIEHVGAIDEQLEALLRRASELKSEIQLLITEGKKYKDISKYLLSYSEFLPVRMEADRLSGAERKKFVNSFSHASELSMFDYAAKQLNALGIDPSMGVTKALQKVEKQDERIATLTAALREVERRVEGVRATKKLFMERQANRHPRPQPSPDELKRAPLSERISAAKKKVAKDKRKRAAESKESQERER